MTDEQLQSVQTLLAKPTGLLLVTGPTGSGKTTSLYAFLSQLNTGQTNIVAIEDPVEHELPGLTQVQIQPKAGLTFATGLRSMLRHDPDIIMVGEIRDQETASLGVRAALTGHLVLSTLHTNDAASGITRLLDLGVEPFLLCSTLSGVLSQRLIRTLCEACRVAVAIDAASLRPLGIAAPAAADLSRIWRAGGCANCRSTGYYGRTAIFELLPVDHHVRSLMIKRTSWIQIHQSAVSRGMMTLADSGWQKVQADQTSVEELVRVLPTELR
jgi:general secretion pathway protein E